MGDFVQKIKLTASPPLAVLSEQRRMFCVSFCVSDESLFYTELLARIYAMATPFPSVIGQLRSQCEEWFQTCAEPILIPKCSFLQQPGGALQYTLTGLHGGE